MSLFPASKSVREWSPKQAPEPDILAKLSKLARDWRGRAYRLDLIADPGYDELQERDTLNACAAELEDLVRSNKPRS